MYLVVVYDIGVERLGSVFRLCNIYFHHVQNSVFEGEISFKGYNAFIDSLKNLIDEEVDSVIIFKFRSDRAFKREVIGLEKGSNSNIIIFDE